MSIIYCAEHIESGRLYVGKTHKTLSSRKSNHYCKARGGSSIYFHKALNKYNKEDFIWGTIEEVNDEKINERETYWISYFNSFDRKKGFNLTNGGEGVSGLSKSIRNELSEIRKNWWKNEDNKKMMKEAFSKRKITKGIERPSIKREKHPRAKKILCIETNETFNCIRDAADKYNLQDTHIVAVCRGRLKTTGKKHWIYT